MIYLRFLGHVEAKIVELGAGSTLWLHHVLFLGMLLFGWIDSMLMQYVSLYLNLFGYILGLYRFVGLYEVFHIVHNYWNFFIIMDGHYLSHIMNLHLNHSINLYLWIYYCL